MARSENQPCPKCESTKTFRTAAEHTHDYWHCYACGKTFDVPREGNQETPKRRAADTRRKIR